MATDALNLKDSVVKAFEDAAKGTATTETTTEVVEETTEGTEDEVDSTDEPSTDNATDTSEVIEINATADEINRSLALQRDLLDPAKRADVLERLAKEAGYNLGKIAEVKQFKKDTKALFKEKLGDIYELVGGDNLANAIDEIVAEQVSILTKPALDKVAAQEANANLQKADAAMATFFTNNKIEAKDREPIAKKMLVKMAELPPGQGVDAVKYLNDIYSLVSRSDTRVKVTRETVDKINKNAKEMRQVSGKESPDDKRVTIKVKKLPSLHESVAAAARNETLDYEG